MSAPSGVQVVALSSAGEVERGAGLASDPLLPSRLELRRQWHVAYQDDLFPQERLGGEKGALLDLIARSPWAEGGSTWSRLEPPPSSPPPPPLPPAHEVVSAQRRLMLPGLPPLVTGSLYALHGSLYEAPPLQALLRLRLATSARHLLAAHSALRGFTQFEPLAHYMWAEATPVPPSSSGADEQRAWLGSGDGLLLDSLTADLRRLTGPKKKRLLDAGEEQGGKRARTDSAPLS